jgi:hypothetical protein
MQALSEAEEKGDVDAVSRAQRMIEAFTDQLDESNPVLTAISDAMTAEADAIDALAELGASGDAAAKERLEAEVSVNNVEENVWQEFKKTNVISLGLAFLVRLTSFRFLFKLSCVHATLTTDVWKFYFFCLYSVANMKRRKRLATPTCR